MPLPWLLSRDSLQDYHKPRKVVIGKFLKINRLFHFQKGLIVWSNNHSVIRPFYLWTNSCLTWTLELFQESEPFSGTRNFARVLGTQPDCSSSEAVPEPLLNPYSRLGTFHLNTNYWGGGVLTVIICNCLTTCSGTNIEVTWKCEKGDVAEQKLSRWSCLCISVTFNALLNIFLLHIYALKNVIDNQYTLV